MLLVGEIDMHQWFCLRKTTVMMKKTKKQKEIRARSIVSQNFGSSKEREHVKSVNELKVWLASLLLYNGRLTTLAQEI